MVMILLKNEKKKPNTTFPFQQPHSEMYQDVQASI